MTLLRASIAILLPALLLVVGGTAAGAILTVRMSLHAPGAGAGLFEPGSVSLSSWASMGDAHHRGIVLTTILAGLGVSLLSTAIGALLALLAAPFAGLRFMGMMVLILAPRLSGVLASLFGFQRPESIDPGRPKKEDQEKPQAPRPNPVVVLKPQQATKAAR